MARYIDENEIKDALYRYPDNEYEIGWNDALHFVLKKPTADVVEVVRCKDCKYGNELTDENGYRFILCSNHYGHGLMVSNYDFCSQGKRREET